MTGFTPGLNRQKVQTFLEVVLRQDNKIYYGLNESPASRITCFFESAADGGHMHFVDGNNGGYASAARQLKSQIDAT